MSSQLVLGDIGDGESLRRSACDLFQITEISTIHWGFFSFMKGTKVMREQYILPHNPAKASGSDCGDEYQRFLRMSRKRC